MKKLRGFYSRFLFLNAGLGLVGWILSTFAGAALFNNANWFFNGIASILPLPTPYNQGAFVSFFVVYGLWFLAGSFIIVVFFRRPTRPR